MNARMIEAVVRYLHDAGVPFRLVSFPRSEPLPNVAFPLPPGACIVDTHVVLVNGAAALACTARGETLSLIALSDALGGAALEASAEDAARIGSRARGPLPPLGGLLGVPLLLDARVAEAPVIVFPAFSQGDVVAIDYDDFARLETPRVASFAVAGELTAHSASH